MNEWILIVVTSSAGLIQSWDGHSISHVRFSSQQECKDAIVDTKKIAPDVPLTMTCVRRKDLKRWRPKAG